MEMSKGCLSRGDDRYMTKIQLAIFGTGLFYKKRKEKLTSINDIEICVFLDNNMSLWGTRVDGVLIVPPNDLDKVLYDYVVIMSSYEVEMYEQLINMGVEQSKILYWGNFIAKFSQEKRIYYTCNMRRSEQEPILIITTNLNYNGGTMAAIYAAMCLQSKRYKVDLAAPWGNPELIHEINGYEINVIIDESLPYIEEEKWIKKYRVVIVNVFQMIQCACEISKYRPVLWWIHEPSISYNKILKQFAHYINIESIKYANIWAVSHIAKSNFNVYFPNRIEKVLNYGIPDIKIEGTKVKKKQGIVFAIIGAICDLKAQDVFLQAANGIIADEPIEFWIIGALGEDVYGCHIKELAKQNPDVKLLGVLSRREIYEKLVDIDVVVCISREDSLPIVMTEAMMFHKICIISNKTGTVDYIVDGENGLVVEVDNVEMLQYKMQWVVDHQDKLGEIGDKARETYEKYFSMKTFGDNLERAITETMNEWRIKE